MKKKIKTTTRELKMPCLYRDDLELIENIIKNELKPQEYKIETHDYEYEGLDRIPKNTDPVTEFHITTYKPLISIDLDRNSARIYSGNDDLTTMGALHKITDILLKKERKLLFWSQKSAFWTAPILIVLFSLATKEIELASMKFGIFFLIITWFVTSYYFSIYKYSIVSFVYLRENPGFINKNKDRIILIILGAIIGEVIRIFARLFVW